MSASAWNNQKLWRRVKPWLARFLSTKVSGLSKHSTWLLLASIGCSAPDVREFSSRGLERAIQDVSNQSEPLGSPKARKPSPTTDTYDDTATDNEGSADNSAQQVWQEYTVPGPTLSSPAGQISTVSLIYERLGIQVRLNGQQEDRELDHFQPRMAEKVVDLVRFMQSMDIVGFEHMGVFNPNSVLPTSGRPSQHARAAAIDISAVIMADGSRYSVLTDWNDSRAKTVFGALTSYMCTTFTVVINPDTINDTAHDDHYHIDATRGFLPGQSSACRAIKP